MDMFMGHGRNCPDEKTMKSLISMIIHNPTFNQICSGLIPGHGDLEVSKNELMKWLCAAVPIGTTVPAVLLLQATISMQGILPLLSL
jgi:hypothetical protein